MTFFTTRPLWVLVLTLVVLTALAMMGPLLIRRRIALERLRTNNEVAGFKFATIGVLYAVLLAFVVIITWERFNEAERALTAEAGAAIALFRLSTGVDEATGTKLRDQTVAYLRSVLEEDWPAMANGHWSRETSARLNELYWTVVHYRPADLHDADLQQDLLREVDKLTEARRTRLVMAAGTVPNAIWFVVFLGAVLTISFTFFFGTQNVLSQCLMTGVLAALIFSAILVVIAIDRPFTGAVVVPTESIRTVLEEFQAARSEAVKP